MEIIVVVQHHPIMYRCTYFKVQMTLYLSILFIFITYDQPFILYLPSIALHIITLRTPVSGSMKKKKKKEECHLLSVWLGASEKPSVAPYYSF